MKPRPGQRSWQYANDLNRHHDGPWTEEEREQYEALVTEEYMAERRRRAEETQRQ